MAAAVIFDLEEESTWRSLLELEGVEMNGIVITFPLSPALVENLEKFLHQSKWQWLTFVPQEENPTHGGSIN